MISVVIPLYNKEHQIAKTLQSVFAQTYTDYEIVVVNDGSTDNSAEVVEKINDPRIMLVNQQNAGVSAARNTGIAKAKGEYIALLDADDEWKPNYLETISDMILRYPQCSVYATNYTHVTTDGREIPTTIRKINFSGSDGILNNYFEVASVSSPPICSISIVAKKKAFLSIGGFPIGIKSGEDLLTWARLACLYSIAYSKKVCSVYYLGEGYDFSKRPTRKQDAGDPVGKELKHIFNTHKSIKGLKNYLSLWHKMRASVAIRFGFSKEALIESLISLRYNPLNYKVIPFIFISVTPSFIRKKIICLKNN